MKFKLVIPTLMMLLLATATAFAADEINSGDTAWMIVATALVMMMTPAGLALFYGGMSRYKNLLNTYAMTLVAYCIASVIWVTWGYTLAFGPDLGGFIGNFDYFMLSGIGPKSVSGSIPTYVFLLFQMTFAGITVALIIGSVVDRMKFSAWVIFTVCWVTVVYLPIAHWVWGGGWLGKIGALDFAGGNVVHINAGIGGLVLALMLGRRIGYKKEAMFPSSVVLTSLGAALLWFGWFGFNAGSQLAADGVAGSAFLVTNTSAAVAALTWMMAEAFTRQKPTLLGLVSGLVAGLVAITPAAGFVNLPASLIIGLGAGIFGFYAVVQLKPRMGYDDSLDAFGVHGICGMWGAVATGIFAHPDFGVSGLIYGNPKQLLIQIISIVATIAYTAVGTWVTVWITRLLAGGIRVQNEEEILGLDNAMHGERAFEF